MASEVERFLFGENPVAHFVHRFEFSSTEVLVHFRPLDPNCGNSLVARFENANITSIEQNSEKESGRLDIIGLDSYRYNELWRFVLNCGLVEWVWTSSWPSIESS